MKQYVNGKYFEVPEEYVTKEEIQSQIDVLKIELSAYDYIGVKIAMGVATKEEYAEQIAYTETLREKIRALEQEV